MGSSDEPTYDIVGVDLSGRTTGDTALALLTGRADDVPRAEPIITHGGAPLGRRPDARLIARICAELSADIVAIDAPLELPHPVTCTEQTCRTCFPDDGMDASYASRGADRTAAWRAAGHPETAPMATAMLGGIAFRGIYLRRALERLGVPTLETWPKGVYRATAARDGVTAPPPPSSEGDAYVAWATPLLRRRVAARWEEHGTPDRIDAVAAAYAGWVHLTRAEDGCVHVGGRDGFICVPARGPADR